MIIVKVMGGLGNQMFQYALYKRLKAEGKNAKIDLGWCELTPFPYLIREVFDVEGDIATYKETRKLGAYSKYRFMRSLDHRFGLMKNKKIIGNPNAYFFDQSVEDEIQRGGNLYLNGFWQNAKWFETICDIIQEDFRFKRPLDEEGLRILEQLQSPNAVAIHVRWYAGEGVYECQKNMEYFETAMEYFLERMENITFFVFSDNIRWCHENFKVSNAVLVDSQNIAYPERDMRLMSYSNNCVISNSTYSWWSAYLNPRHVNKTIVAPKEWVKEFNPYNPNMDGWVELDRDKADMRIKR